MEYDTLTIIASNVTLIVATQLQFIAFLHIIDAAYLVNYTVVISPARNDTSTMCGSESLNVTVSLVSWRRLSIH